MDVKVSVADNQIIKICRAYWEIDSDDESFLYKIKDIAIKFDISQNEIIQIAKKFCVANSSTIFCKTCEQPYIYSNRSDYTSSLYRRSPWVCNKCIINEQKKIADRKQEIENDKQRILIKEFNEHRLNHPVILSELNVRSAVLLLSLIRFGANEDLSYIHEHLINKTALFSPDTREDMNFLRELYQEKYIALDPLSNPRSIVMENDQLKFYLNSVRWVIPLPEGETLRYFVEQLEIKLSSMEYLDSSYEEVIELVKEISLMECLAYLQDSMDEHDLDFSPGEKTRLVLSKALEKYSVAQVYNFMWRSVKDSAAYYMSMKANGISKKHAANTVVGRIEKCYEQATNNNWPVKAYGRNYHKPQSIISQVLFNVLLHTDDGGFHLPLSKLI